jgi:drug/metabolite transporter (DMT)-like permease
VWVVLALGAAAFWGTADFLGGLAARRTPALRVLLVGLPAGLLCLIPILVLGDVGASTPALVWGGAAGVAGGLGIAALYAALGIGPMNVVAPLSAVASAVVPVVAGLVQGERPGPWALVGMAIAGGAVVLISREPPEANEPSPVATRQGVGLALAAGALIGTGLVFLDRVADEGSLWPVAANRVVAWLVVLAVALIVGSAGVPPRAALPLALGAGILDTVANVAYFNALEDGLLSVVGVIVALYPGGTVLLARVVLREELHPPQVLGLLLAAGGVVLMVLG